MRSSYDLDIAVPIHRTILIRTVALALALCTFVAHAAPLPDQVMGQKQHLAPYQAQIQARLDANHSLIRDISQQLEEQKLPTLLALLPMLESSFNPKAVSHANAAGLWQLIPATAQRFGLEVSQNQDQRFDTQASTQAAIQYLSFLHNKFDDLALALAAYNAGEGRVSRAIKQAGSTHFSALKLPKETRQYVSRFYALLELVEWQHLTQPQPNTLFLFGQSTTQPLIDLTPLPPLITL